jgi:hypothetical protein
MTELHQWIANEPVVQPNLYHSRLRMSENGLGY